MKGNLVHTETENGIIYRLYIQQDDSDVRGNAMVSGDDAADKALEDEIIERLDNGDTWAWAVVTVTATRADLDGEKLEGRDSLGGCCYRDTAEFIAPGGYYNDMKEEALSEHNSRVEKLRGKLCK